jgi:hypothetical protein
VVSFDFLSNLICRTFQNSNQNKEKGKTEIRKGGKQIKTFWTPGNQTSPAAEASPRPIYFKPETVRCGGPPPR